MERHNDTYLLRCVVYRVFAIIESWKGIRSNDLRTSQRNRNYTNRKWQAKCMLQCVTVSYVQATASKTRNNENCVYTNK